MNIIKQAVVLDKSFLQGASASAIQKLSDSHRLVISGALFYELLTCDTRGRRGCFSKLLKTENPVELVENIGKLLKIEINTHQPAGKPSSHKENIEFTFNPKLLTDNYQMPSDAQDAVNEQTDMLQSDIKRFIEIAQLNSKFFPNILSGTDKERAAARRSAEKKITDKIAMLSFYAQLQSPVPNIPFPPHILLDESWATYRWLQVQMLFSIDLFVRYAGNIPEQLTPNIHTKLEHDVLDAQVLMLGCLEGAFATREKKLIHWWHLLCPNGKLFQ